MTDNVFPFGPVSAPDEEPPVTSTPIALEMEEQAAEVFAARHGLDFKFDHSANVWRKWNGAVWQQDFRFAADYAMRTLVRETRTNSTVTATIRNKVGKSSFSTSALKAATTNPALATIHDDYDQHATIISSPDKMHVLDAGMSYPNNPKNMISRCLTVEPAESPNHPLWDKFMEEVTAGQEGLADYLQIFFGYCLTTYMKEEIVTFIYGPGGNGKGVLLHAISEIFGDYKQVSPPDIFMKQKYPKSVESYIVKLAGARLVITSEVAEDDEWNVDLLKRWSGNEVELSGRALYANPIEFKPVGKLVIVGNHKPTLATVDAAMARRMRMLPFMNTPENVDVDLKDKMRDAYPNIARWLLDGARRYHEEGLVPPACVESITSEYLAEQDTVGQFLDDAFYQKCGDEKLVLRRDVMKAAKVFASRNGVKSPTPHRIYKRLSDLAYDTSKDSKHRTQRCIFNLQLREEYLKELIKREQEKENPQQIWSSTKGELDYDPNAKKADENVHNPEWDGF